jgi:hypothetical protein
MKPMTRLSVAALVLALASCQMPLRSAAAASLPKFYVGGWCPFSYEAESFSNMDEFCEGGAEHGRILWITPNSISSGSDTGDCRILRIRLGKPGSPATKTPRSEWIPSAKITARCRDGQKYFINLSVGHGVIYVNRVSEWETKHD